MRICDLFQFCAVKCFRIDQISKNIVECAPLYQRIIAPYHRNELKSKNHKPKLVPRPAMHPMPSLKSSRSAQFGHLRVKITKFPPKHTPSYSTPSMYSCKHFLSSCSISSPHPPFPTNSYSRHAESTKATTHAKTPTSTKPTHSNPTHTRSHKAPTASALPIPPNTRPRSHSHPQFHSSPSIAA